MKILLDENINKNLKGMLGAHNVFTVKDMKWIGKKNGELLRLAESDNFDVFISNDSNLRYQIKLENYKLNFIIFRAKSNNLHSILPLIPRTLEYIQMLMDTKAIGIS